MRHLSNRFSIEPLADGVALYDHYLRRSHCARGVAAEIVAAVSSGTASSDDVIAEKTAAAVDESARAAIDDAIGALRQIGFIEPGV
ncbi:MAG: hypothetical protein Tsb0010_01000 [Parvularculaceae bacterium]